MTLKWSPQNGNLLLASGWKTTNTAKGDNKLYSDAKGVVPSLDLRFAESKTLNDHITGQNLITFSRADATTCATYVDSNGIIQTAAANVPRFDHDPANNNASLGLLIEESRTNLVTYSEEFDNAAWNSVSSLTVSATTNTAPNDTNTAYLIYPNTSGNSLTIDQNFGSATGTFTSTIFAKADGKSWLVLWGARGSKRAWFNVSTGVKGTVDLGLTASIVPLPNGWYQCSVTETISAQRWFYAAPADNDGSTAVTTSGTDGILIWGAQLEEGSFPSSYVPTTNAAVTRAADVASITGSNFSSWYNQSEGTLFANADRINSGVDTVDFAMIGTSGSLVFNPQSWGIYAPSGYNNSYGFVRTSSAYQFSDGSAILNAKSALSISGTSVSFCSSGSAIVSGSIPSMPTGVNELYLNSGVTGSPNKTISRLTYFPERLPDATLQAITQ